MPVSRELLESFVRQRLQPHDNNARTDLSGVRSEVSLSPSSNEIVIRLSAMVAQEIYLSHREIRHPETGVILRQVDLGIDQFLRRIGANGPEAAPDVRPWLTPDQLDRLNDMPRDDRRLSGVRITPADLGPNFVSGMALQFSSADGTYPATPESSPTFTPAPRVLPKPAKPPPAPSLWDRLEDEWELDAA